MIPLLFPILSPETALERCQSGRARGLLLPTVRPVAPALEAHSGLRAGADAVGCGCILHAALRGPNVDEPAQLVCPCCSVRPSRYNWFGEDLYERILCEECRRKEAQERRMKTQEYRGQNDPAMNEVMWQTVTSPPCDSPAPSHPPLPSEH